MKFATIIFLLALTFPAFGARVLTYTATSKTSQEDANNAAMAGIAKQIVAEVNTNQNFTKKESIKNNQAKLDESFFSNNNIKSEIKIKGIKIIPIKTDGKNYKATATLDLDEFTSDIQFKMKLIKEDVNKLESNAQESLQKRLYFNAAKDIEKASVLIKNYEGLLLQLSKVYPLNDSHKLIHNISELENQLILQVSKIKITKKDEIFELTKSEMPEWSVTVEDSQGPLPSFPIIAKQGRQTLSEKRSNEKGVVTFLLRKVNFETGPYSITVLPNLPLKILKEAGLTSGIAVEYKVIRSRYEINLECKEIANICTALEDALNKKSIFLINKETKTKVNVELTSNPLNSVTTENGVINSYEIKLLLNNDKIHFQKKIKSVGKNELEATLKAIQKIDFLELQQQLKPSIP